MAIDLTGLSSTPSTSNRGKAEGLGQSQTGKSQADTTTTDQAKQATVQLSDEALSLQKLEEQVAQLPDVDTDRVNSIRQAIEDGSYKIDADKLAASMLDFEDQIFG